MAAFLRVILVTLSFLGLSGCFSFSSGPAPYTGPAITLVEIHKADRKMFLIAGDKVVKTYNIQLGGNPVGPKQFEGDGKTPEGSYYITHRNPRSAYHLSLGISYPNAAQVAYAKAQGKQPGGDIFVHGQPNRRSSGGGDWTAGCIAVTNREIEEIYRMVNPGTPINIFP